MEVEKALTLAMALLAFLVAFYSLITRERRSLIVSSSYHIITFSLICVALGVLCAVWLIWSQGVDQEAPFRSGAAVGVGLIAVCVVYGVLRERSRQTRLRTEPLPAVWDLVQRGLRRAAPEHTPHGNFEAPLTPELEALFGRYSGGAEPLRQAFDRQHMLEGMSVSVVVLARQYMHAEKILFPLARTFFRNERPVCYLSCSRHPIEFAGALIRTLENKQAQVHDRNVFYCIDGYSSHFGFGEKVHCRKRKEVAKEYARDCYPAGVSYAGIHSAIIRVYQRICKRMKQKDLSGPTLMIYEGCHAIVDMEGPEQYRLFARHVMPSERLWGGMMTVFVETLVSEENKALLLELADVVIDLTDPRTADVGPQLGADPAADAYAGAVPETTLAATTECESRPASAPVQAPEGTLDSQGSSDAARSPSRKQQPRSKPR
jgi:hypothetical protein